MKWFWRVRLYNDNGHYVVTEIATNRDLNEIDAIQQAYFYLTGCKMLLEGMSETSHHFEGQPFYAIWKCNQ